jgi:hemolysin activation/secretion protein
MMKKSALVCVMAVLLTACCLPWSAAEDISGIDFSGNTVFSGTVLAQAVADSKGRPADEEQLAALKKKVVSWYYDRGYIAQAEVTQEGGRVTVKVLESRANIIIEHMKGTETLKGIPGYSESFVRSHFSRLTKGPWRMPDLERSLLILRDLPGLDGVTATLAPSKTDAGVTDIRIGLDDDGSQQLAKARRRWNFGLRGDNFGSPYASRTRLAESVKKTNLTQRGDEFQLQAVHGPSSADLLYWDVRGTVPLRGDGTKLNAYFSTGDFAVGQDLAVLNLKGDGTFYGISATRPITRTRYRSVTGEVGLDISNTNLKMEFGPDQISIGEDKVRKLRLGATWDTKAKNGNSRQLVNVYLHQGLGGFLGGTGSSDAGSRVGADNFFTKLTLEAARQQRVNNLMTVNFGLTGQFSTKSLLVGEEFSIGGADSVRGYPQSLFIGDSGLQASVELRYAPPSMHNKTKGWLRDLNLVAFVDHGQVFIHSSQPGESTPPAITGAGFGVRALLGSSEKPYNLRCDLGFPLSGHKPKVGGGVQPYVRLDHQF